MLSEQRWSQQSGNARICRQTRKQTTFVLNFMSKPYQRGTSDEYKLERKESDEKAYALPWFKACRAERKEQRLVCVEGEKSVKHGFAKERTKRQYSDCRVSQKKKKAFENSGNLYAFKRHKRTKNDMKREYLSVKTLKFRRSFRILSRYRIQGSQSMKKPQKTQYRLQKTP